MVTNDLSFVEPRIGDAILIIRGRQVMLDADLAALYEVETKVLNQAVKRHGDRFPDDFMFQLTKKEFEHLRSQIVTSNRWGGR
ncbi:MAG: ORF6N domain-containing protein, partial [Deltaproteobacteria bacterium]|nr:ORF6N domain-containing protein [Deltaproteobacteria bacterium]